MIDVNAELPTPSNKELLVRLAKKRKNQKLVEHRVALFSADYAGATPEFWCVATGDTIKVSHWQKIDGGE